MTTLGQGPVPAINVDQLARDKINEIERSLELGLYCNRIDAFNSCLSILKQIITAADLHRTNDKNDIPEQAQTKQEVGESIYADYSDDNEQFNAVDLTEQFATNRVKWTIRVQAFKIVHRLVQLFITNNPTKAGHSKSPLLKHLPDLMRLAFVAATSPYDDLKMQGFEMFRYLINVFASQEEKEFPGHSILEQYKTQVLSAIKPAFNTDAPPYITAIASQVCSLWLCRGLEKEPNDLKRTYQLMLVSIEKLDNQITNQNSKLYTESELEQERVDILSAWAQLYIASKEPGLADKYRVFQLTKTECDSLSPLVEPQVEYLIDKWWEALKDYALLIMPAPRSIGISHDSEHVYTRDVALRLFGPNWPKLVLASAIWLCNLTDTCLSSTKESENNNECHQFCDISANNSPKRSSRKKYFNFLCGIIMKELCRCQTNTDKPEEFISISTIFAVRSLHLLLANKQVKSIFLSNLSVAQEFYTSIFNILAAHNRDPYSILLRDTLDLIYTVILTRVVESANYVRHGLARLVNSLMITMKDTDFAFKRESTEIDKLKFRMSIVLNNLITLMKISPKQATNEFQLREAITFVFQEMLLFRPNAAITSSEISQFRNFYSILKETFPDNFDQCLSEASKTRLDSILELKEADQPKLDVKNKSHFQSKKPVSASTKPQEVKIRLKTDFSNFYSKKP